MQAPALSHHLARKQKILLTILGIAGGAACILIMATVFFSKDSLEPLVTKIAAQQEELLRVNDLVDKFTPSLATRQLQATVASIVTSDLQEIIHVRSDLVSAKITKETSSLYADTDAEDRFREASQRNALDQEYRDTLSRHLKKIEMSVGELSGKSKSSQLKTVLGNISTHDTFLLEQL